ncbi:MAG TPA: VPDSG-CTERM sorting domain-containing protein [Verrucomicrobiae bacterium]|nr:VPDSG-CTERM sorting domain-containing protein [Verrucomicrobiae bacterium]
MKTNLLAVITVSTCLNALAVPVNITRFDGQSGNGGGVWGASNGLGSALEDNETEPTTATGDEWDLEALVYNPASSRLSVVGTFDFVKGVDVSPAHTVVYGAIFVKSLSAATWSHAYVLDFNGQTYSLYDNFTTVAPTDVLASGPYTIDTATANLLGSGSFDYATGVADPFALGLQRESGFGHNQIDLDLSLLGGMLNAFDIHTTMTCGNDTLEGQFVATNNVPDAGSTALLLSVGVLAFGVLRRQH